MFTGIVEIVGEVVELTKEGTNTNFIITSALSNQLVVDQSISHNGVCLTVTKVEGYSHWVTAIDETLTKSNLGGLKKGSLVNLERSMLANSRFDGHIVQGHVDQIGVCKGIKEMGGSWLFDFEYDSVGGNLTVEKGSICVNGVSLTCFNSGANNFTVAIIPYTFKNTNFSQLEVGDSVNLEFDIVGKYIKKLFAESRIILP